MNEDRNEGMKEDKEMMEMDASGVSMEVAGSGEPATQEEENAGMEEVYRRELERRGYDCRGLSREQVIALFNEDLKSRGKEYWYCPDCGRFHPQEWKHCDLPCTLYEKSKDITEEEWDALNFMFDPSDYTQDDAHLQFPHTRIASWLRKAERVYQAKKHLKTFDIHNSPNASQREHPMTEEEKWCWIEEIQAFMQAKQYRHIAWRNTTPAYIKEYHPGNCTLKPVIRTKTLKNGENEKIVECVEYVRV